jgi:hypothetical protein
VSAAGWQQRAASSLDRMLVTLVVNWPLNRYTSSCRKFKARFLDEKGINHLEELFLSERFVDFLIYVGRFHALSHLATILKARSRNNGQQLSAA